MYGHIYKISNKINNKVYIGKTVKTCEERLNEHIETALNGASFKLSNAIRKYGKDNFFIEEVDITETPEDLNLKEIYWIAYYDSFNNGYNMTIGGGGGDTYAKRSPEQMVITRAKIAKKAHEHNSNHGQYISDKNSMYGKQHTDETKKAMHDKLAGRKKPEGHGKHVSEATKGVPKHYIPAVVKLYVIDCKTDEPIERLSAKEIVAKYQIKDFKELKLIVDNKQIVKGYIFSKSVSTIPDECKGVE